MRLNGELMIYFFSSNFYPLYQKDVLDACCYPEGHVLRLRYSEGFVPECVRSSPANWLDHKGLIIFADKESAGAESADFVFYPIREAKIANIQLLAGILFVDVILGEFVNYGAEDDKTKEEYWDHTIKQLPRRPHPPGSVDEGYFFYVVPKDGVAYSIEQSGEQLAWRSVIERINRSSLSGCVTFRVLGFYRTRQGNEQAAQILPTVSGAECLYKVRMGELIVVTLLFYRSRKAPKVDRILEIRAGGHAFSSTSVDRISVQYRYNHQMIFLACNRVTERTVSSLRVVQAGDSNDTKWSPEPSFILSVEPARGFLFLVAAIFGLGLFFLNASSPFISLFKILGTLLVIAASWLFMRKFPLK